MPTIDIGFSPCPNDTFIFDALVNHKIDTKGFDFKLHLEDVQTLNEWALQGKLPYSKISYGVWPKLKNQYQANPTHIAGKPDATTMRVAIPGMDTTAHLLFSLAFPNVTNKVFLVFNEIEEAVLSGKVDAGVIIHENRFTYADKGLSKWLDLGHYFETSFNAPIPLGGIIARKDQPQDEIKLIDALIQESVEFAFKNSYEQLPEFVKCHSQEMSEQVMRQHINLYVNDFSIQMGEVGKNAINKLEEVYNQLGL
jgi:1,4-dihydroxy-6-naphthoate synthase